MRRRTRSRALVTGLACALPILLLAPTWAWSGTSEAATKVSADAEGEYRELRRDYQRAWRDFRREQRRIEGEQGEAAALAYEKKNHPAAAHADAFLARARQYAGTDDAVQFLLWVVSNVKSEPVAGTTLEAMKLLATDHYRSRDVLQLIHGLDGDVAKGPGRVYALLDVAIEHGGSTTTRQLAKFARARALHRVGNEAEKKQAVAQLEALKKEASGVLGEQIESWLFEQVHLQIGSIAPDIEGVDLDGVSFKLSDYRGKVVMLDFWGDW